MHHHHHLSSSSSSTAILLLSLIIAISCDVCIGAAMRDAAFIGYTEQRSIRITMGHDGPSIRVILEPRHMPNTIALIEHAMRDGLSGSWYRNEAVPTPEEGSGPPYGLLQGKMHGITFPKDENNVRASDEDENAEEEYKTR